VTARTRAALTAALLALTVACSNESPPGADAPPLVPVSSPTPTDTPSATPSATPSTPVVAQTLCERLDATVVAAAFAAPAATVSAAPPSTEFGVPTYDVCTIDLAGKPALRVGVSVLAATRAELAAARKGEPARTAVVGEGGFGTSRFVVFLAAGRLVKISGDRSSYPGYLAVAREAARRITGLPLPGTEVTLPECDRGGSAAATVLGASPVLRRDRRNAYGDVECGWATATRAVSTSATRVKDATPLFRSGPGVEPVPLGDDGQYDARTHAVRIRVGTTKVAYFTPAPAGTGEKDDVISFALRMSGLYTR